MNILLETNILLTVSQPDHTLYSATNATIERLNSDTLCILPQNLYEFWTAATRRPEANGLNFDVNRAADQITRFRSLFLLLPDPLELVDEWQRVIKAHGIKGKHGHDARLVAAMNWHGITQIVTFDRSDFIAFSGIQVIEPTE